jgi:hypothetical protein
MHNKYSLRSILVVADLDVSRQILCIDTSESATTNMERRKWQITLLWSNIE